MIKLLKYISVLLLVICWGYHTYAQVPVYRVVPGRRYVRVNQNPEGRVGNIKVNFIRNRLNLNPWQAQRFFPLYVEYQQELFNVRKLKRQNSMNSANGPDQINRELFYENQIVQIKIKFNNAFLKVLPPDKVSELYKAEQEFNDELVRQLSERRGGPPPVPTNNP
jgi:hypothetical protein